MAVSEFSANHLKNEEKASYKKCKQIEQDAKIVKEFCCLR